MAKKFAILLALAPLAACDQFGGGNYGTSNYGAGNVGVDSFNMDSYGIGETAKSAIVGGLVGGATNFIVGGNIAQGTAIGAISSAGAQFLTN